MRALLGSLCPVVLRLGLGLLLAGVAAFPATGTAPAAAAGTLVTHGPASAKRIALTFDDGPAPATEQFLDLLRRHHVHATFFMLGDLVQRHPTLVRKLVEQGHEVGTHTFDHTNYATLYRETAARATARGDASAEAQAEAKRCLRTDLRRSRETIEKASGVPVTLCRMPYGIDRPWVKEVAKETGLVLVNWTYGADWQTGSAKELQPGYLKAIRPGAILLFHDGRKEPAKSLALAEAVIRAAEERGFEMVTVSQLLQGGSPGDGDTRTR